MGYMVTYIVFYFFIDLYNLRTSTLQQIIYILLLPLKFLSAAQSTSTTITIGKQKLPEPEKPKLSDAENMITLDLLLYHLER